MNPQIKTLKGIFKNDPRVFVEERVNLNTGNTDYGIVATRSISESEVNELHNNGFNEKFIGATEGAQMVIILGLGENKQ